MTLGSPLINGSHRPQVCPFAGRRADETLHDFLMRRHAEMAAEIAALDADAARQAAALRSERQARTRSERSLVLGQAWSAAFAAGLCSLFAPGDSLTDWLTLVVGVSAASLIGGLAILRRPPAFTNACARIRSWRRR